MKKTFTQSQLDIAQTAFEETYASTVISARTLKANLGRIYAGYCITKRSQPELTFQVFCENKGREIVMTAAPELHMKRVKAAVQQNRFNS